uniref:BED-type domain-containing protein n=1 Tax=Pygocentrus nattereri TaxID=42514 RepID=A0AAR2J935_PYGNA
MLNMSEDTAPASQSTALDLIPRRGSSSLAWRWFGFEKTDVGQKTPICKLCKKAVAVKESSTTNLFHHLRTNHRKDYEEYEKLREIAVIDKPETTNVSGKTHTQQSLTEAFNKKVPYNKKGSRWQEITDAVTYYIAKDMVPIQVVERDGFKQLLNTIDSRYKLPGRKYFSQTVAHFSTTADLWSSRTSEPYLSLTAHFIDEFWQLQSYCLQTSYFPEDHTGELIAQGLQDALASWSLREDRMVCMTTDSGANVVSALRINKWKRLPCFGHRLHIAIDRAIGVCKKVVGAFSNSWKKKKKLADAQEQLKLPEHKLITESPTRWGSRQCMIERFLEQEKAIRHVLAEDKKHRHLVPTWQDVEVLEAVSKALGPLLEFTDALSGEKLVTVSYLKPVLALFNTELNTKYTEDCVDELLSLASTLDPRFKNRYNDDDTIKVIVTTATAELQAIATEEDSPTQGLSTASAQASATKVGGDDDTGEPAKKTQKSFSSYFKKLQEFKEGESLHTIIEKEIKSYLMIPEVDSDVNPLDWWKTQEVNFPRLGKLAKKYLCIPASSSPSERVFSTGGNIITCNRAALKPDAVDRLVFLSHNLR